MKGGKPAITAALSQEIMLAIHIERLKEQKLSRYQPASLDYIKTALEIERLEFALSIVSSNLLGKTVQLS